MTFRLFTNVASMGSQKHIYEYVSSSGSYRACTIRLSVAGYSSSGSYRACTIRLSVVGVLLIRFRPRPSLFIGTVLLPSHPEGPVSQQKTTILHKDVVVSSTKSLTIFSNCLNLNGSSSYDDPTIQNPYGISAIISVYSFFGTF